MSKIVDVLTGAGGRFLASRLSGYLALALVVFIGGFIVSYRDRGTRIDLLIEQCRAKQNYNLDLLVEELKERNNERYEELISVLNSRNDPCLDWVYDPDSPGTAGDPPVREAGAEDE